MSVSAFTRVAGTWCRPAVAAAFDEADHSYRAWAILRVADKECTCNSH